MRHLAFIASLIAVGVICAAVPAALPAVAKCCGRSVTRPGIAPGPMADLLLEDGSFLLLEDNTSNLCLEGGCFAP